MNKRKKDEFISIPIYLDQKVVFDHMAIIEDGYSNFTSIVETDSEGKKRSAVTDASLGTSNALSFLGVSLGVKAGTTGEKEAKAQTQAAERCRESRTGESVRTWVCSSWCRGLPRAAAVGVGDTLPYSDAARWKEASEGRPSPPSRRTKGA